MTIAMTSVGSTLDPAVSWRALEGGLWVARRSGRHLGAVQRGRRWVAADAEGEPIGRFRTFREAQTAVADPGADRGSADRPLVLAPAIATAAVGIAALVSASGWALTTLLA